MYIWCLGCIFILIVIIIRKEYKFDYQLNLSLFYRFDLLLVYSNNLENC